MFARDPDLEHKAMTLLGLSAEDVKRRRLADLRAEVARTDEPPALVPTPKPRQVPVALAPALMATETKMVQVQEEEKLAVIPEQKVDPHDEDIKSIEHLLAPLNIGQICKEPNGLLDLQKRFEDALDEASHMECGIHGTHESLLQYQHVWDSEEQALVESTVPKDGKMMTALAQWVQLRLKELATLIATRLEGQNHLQRNSYSNCTMVCDRLHRRTVKMQALHTVMASKLQCLKIPVVVSEDSKSTV